MSLRRRPTITPALLAANRANARRSTGPRTVEGKNRVVLNALKEGRHARNLGENLRRAKSQAEAELFQWILNQVRAAFRLRGLAGGRAEGRAVSAAGLVRAGTGGAPLVRLRPAAGQRPGEVSPAEGDAVGARLDAAAVGRRRNKPGICREINR
jgi:hypothetical protein